MSKTITFMMMLAMAGLLITTGCEKEPELPAVTTAEVTDLVQTSATCGGEVTFDGYTQVTARGVVYGTSPEPTIDGMKTEDGTGEGVFVSEITGLAPNVTYYVRAYATNSVGTVYGVEREFKTPL
jgi:hypothetical protein